ncbi:hypothetical protein D3C77_531540 [compost metagenome]
MIYSYKRFRKSLPLSIGGRLARALACAFLAPFVLAIAYVVISCIIGGLWLLSGMLGDPAALIPYACCAFIFMVLWLSWEARRNRKLYRTYMSEQSKDALEHVALAPDGNFSKYDRVVAADVLYADQTRPAV